MGAAAASAPTVEENDGHGHARRSRSVAVDSESRPSLGMIKTCCSVHGEIERPCSASRPRL